MLNVFKGFSKKVKENKVFKILWDNKKSLLILSIVSFLLIATYSFLETSNKSYMNLTMSYPGAEKGENPDGSRFNVFEFKSDEVINRALETGKINNMTVEEIKDRVDIYAKLPKNSTERVTKAKTSGENFYYIPNEFSISYSQKNKLSLNQSVDVLEAMAEGYRQVFEEKYVDKNTVFQSDIAEIGDMSKYEYTEIADFYYDKVSQMERYIQKKEHENGTFRAKSTDQTFVNISTMLLNFKNIEIAKFKGFVVTSAITKNKKMYSEKLNHTNNMLRYDYDKRAYEKSFTVDAIAKYDANITGVAFIPSIDTKDDFYMNRTKTGIDYLTEKAYDAGIYAEKVMSKINKNASIINSVNANKNDDTENARLTKMADNMLVNLDNRLKEISEIALATDKEYIEYKTKNYLNFSVVKKGVSGLINTKQVIFLTAIAIFLICCYFIVFDKVKRRIGR